MEVPRPSTNALTKRSRSSGVPWSAVRRRCLRHPPQEVCLAKEHLRAKNNLRDVEKGIHSAFFSVGNQWLARLALLESFRCLVSLHLRGLQGQWRCPRGRSAEGHPPRTKAILRDASKLRCTPSDACWPCSHPHLEHISSHKSHKHLSAWLPHPPARRCGCPAHRAKPRTC